MSTPISTETRSVDEVFHAAVALDHRPDPYPYWAALRGRPVAERADGGWVAAGHAEITQLLHDPRVSAVRTAPGQAWRPERVGPDGRPVPAPFLRQDPPGHDRLRAVVVDQLVPRVAGMRGHIEELVAGRLDAVAARRDGRIDVVADLAYPLPVAVICELLGIPDADESRFRELARRTTRGLDPIETLRPSEQAEIEQAGRELRGYLTEVVTRHRERPGDDMLSAIIASGELAVAELFVTLGLLLIAGHETTVNLIANGALALLRHPGQLDRLRADPEYAAPLVEEVLRFDPPVQMSARTTVGDIGIGRARIPAGSRVTLLLAAGNRDPRRFADPDVFDPLRPGNAHLGFGGGIHYCVGAALARLEAQVALTELARRIDGARLLADPPPYRDNAVLRGPSAVPVAFDAIR
jgi:cytochrome P450